MLKIFSAYVTAKRLVKELSQTEQPIIIQANIGDTLWVAIFFKLTTRRRVKVVYRNANMMSLFFRGSRVKAFLYQVAFKNVDAVASVSHSCARDMAEMGLVSENRLYVIENGLPIGQIRCEDTNNLVSVRSCTVLHVGAFVPEKNHRGLICAFAAVKKSISQAKLLLVGDGRLRVDTEALVASMGLEDSVEFTGSVSDIWPLLQRASVLAMPSHIEGQPGVILEAFAAGVPVVAYGVGGMPDMLADGCGFCVEHDDQEAFAAALQTVLQRSDNQDMVERARRRLRERHDIKVIAREFHALYQRL